MILDKETLDKFGYLESSLTKGSNKNIVLKCDYCNNSFISSPKKRNKSNLLVNKDSCNNCKYKKMQDNNLQKYGVSNAFQREDIKQQIKQTCVEKYGQQSWVQTEEFKKQAKITNLVNLGVENPMQNKDIIQQRKLLIFAKYGVDNISQVKQFQDKKKQTCLQKFGAETFMSSEIGRKRLNHGVINKYGVDNVFKSQEIKDKIVKSNLKKYNVNYPMQNQEIRDKVKYTNLNKYGYEYISQSPIIQEKIKNTNLLKYGYIFPTQSALIKDKIRNSMIKSGRFKQFNGKSMEELAKEKNIPYTTFVRNARLYGFDFALSIEPHENSLEKLMSNILDTIPIEYTKHNIINKRKTDFLIQDKKLIIECDGNFWHSDLNIKDKRYHSIKKNDYYNAGYKALFFREYEIENKPDILKSIIMNHLSISHKIFARKCTKIIVDKCEANSFFSSNHLMGKGSGTTYGLYFNGELVCAMRIKRIKNKDYEISRFCSKLGYSITGGFSSLIAMFEKDIVADRLITYVDLRYGSGSYLQNLGFTYNKTFLSFKWTNGDKVFNRMKFPNNTGYDKGLYRIWDCGQAKFVKTDK